MEIETAYLSQWSPLPQSFGVPINTIGSQDKIYRRAHCEGSLSGLAETIEAHPYLSAAVAIVGGYLAVQLVGLAVVHNALKKGYLRNPKKRRGTKRVVTRRRNAGSGVLDQAAEGLTTAKKRMGRALEVTFAMVGVPPPVTRAAWKASAAVSDAVQDAEIAALKSAGHWVAGKRRNRR